jgi:hypothetical protein
VPKWRQDVHVAVIDIDVGWRDLQQCADAIMRLRGEWLFSAGRPVAFNDTDGKRRTFAARDKSDHAAFRKYMDLVFAYAATYSLEPELKPAPLADIQIGDVFVKGGFPGHAVLVADMAESAQAGEKRFLLIQSYMPAQEMHVLKNGARRLAVVPGRLHRQPRHTRMDVCSRSAAPLAVTAFRRARRGTS